MGLAGGTATVGEADAIGGAGGGVETTTVVEGAIAGAALAGAADGGDGGGADRAGAAVGGSTFGAVGALGAAV